MRTTTLAFVLLVGVSCRGRGLPPVTQADRVSIPMSMAGDLCLDIADMYVCYRGAEVTQILPAQFPDAPAGPGLGWRCVGQGSQRTCQPRALTASEWRCDATCVQRRPFLPDACPWDCGQIAGVVSCTRPADGACADLPTRAGWFCGRRLGTNPPSAAIAASSAAVSSARSEIVCFDYSPDPPPSGRSRACRFVAEPWPLHRVCTDSKTKVMGDACGADLPCADGALCAFGRCVPPRPVSHCWIDRDCGRGRCFFGTCTEGVP